ncbi:MAG: alpha/beta fold hydrolase [Zetaproteobacteria bacterium]|nr:MAG: alpha/beta fold hydrolase [Zetaproteobacteria bacterium]
MSTAHHHQRLFIDGPAGRLEALFQPGRLLLPAVVVCHPHPLYGGTMRNKVVYWIARAFEDRGCSVLRFNFRGVERSEGAWADGEGECEDVLAALRWLAGRAPQSPLWLAGFSFGCYAGLRAAALDARVERMFAVAPAVHLYDFSFLRGDHRPLTVVQGGADEIVPFAAVRQWAHTLPQAHFHAVPDAGHFFDGYMEQMTRLLLSDIPEPA